MIKILILQGGFNEEHKVSLNSSKEIAKALKKLKIYFKILTVNPLTFKEDIRKYSNNYICFNALHGTFGEDGKIQKILKKYNFKKNDFKNSEYISKYGLYLPSSLSLKKFEIDFICKKLNKILS